MEKNLNINLSGINFFIEESAYYSLQKYLDIVKTHFANFDDFTEIYKDIETRIAEMFTQRLSGSKNVITSSDVTDVIRIMGNPSEFSTSEKEETNTSFSENKGAKRMFRDSENRVLGGICSGLAVYFGIDSVWLRLAFFFSLFLGGFGALLYIVLWIALPKPRSITERIEMKGKPVNLSSIENAIKKNIPTLGNEIKENTITKIILFPFRLIAQIIEGFWYILKKVIPGLGKALQWFAGIMILLIMFIVGILITFTLCVGFGLFYFNEIHFLKLADNSLQYTALISSYFLTLIPVIFILLLGISLLRNKLIITKTTGLTLFFIWILSLIGSTIAFVGIIPEFSQNSSIEKKIDLDFEKYKTIYLRVNKEGQNNYYNTRLYIQQSENNTTELICKYSARGATRQQAKENAREIIYEVSQKDSTLWLQQNFILPDEAFFRVQKVDLILKVPHDKLVNFDENSEELIADSPDKNDYDENHFYDLGWLVTQDGLESDNITENIRRINKYERIKIKFKLRELKSELRDYRKHIKSKFKNDENLDVIKETLDEINEHLNEAYEDIEHVPVSDLKKLIHRLKEKVKLMVGEHEGNVDLLENLNGIEIIINSDKKKEKEEKKIIIGDSIVIKL